MSALKRRLQSPDCTVETDAPTSGTLASMTTIRDETAADAGAIADVTIAAFRMLAVSSHTEQFIVAALRAANALNPAR